MEYYSGNAEPLLTKKVKKRKAAPPMLEEVVHG